MAILKVGDIFLPSPVELSTDDELIWSEETGRVASGKMVGDVIAQKKTLSITWGILTEQEVSVIAQNLKSGFFPITFRDNGTLVTIQTYRGTLAKEHLGELSDGIYYYKSVTCELVQQ